MNRKCKIFFFALIILVDFAEMVCDWFFYADMKTAEKGLVYGKPDQAAVVGLLVFSIIGTIGYIFEIVNLGVQLRRGKAIVNVDFVAALIVWFEDLPQLAISIFIARCREEAVSVFQIGKAVVIVMSIILKFIVYCIKCSKKKKKVSCLSKWSRVFAIIGFVCALACAVAVFVFTKANRNKDGVITFSEPETVIEERFNDQRYFRNVSIFVSLPAFKTSWMRVASIDSVRSSPDKSILFLFEYQHTDSDMRVRVQKNDGNYVGKECYTIGNTNVSSAQCDKLMEPETNIQRYVFRFTFIPPNIFFRKMIFGDIKFNVRKETNGTCLNNMEQISVHYFRSEGAKARFYKEEGLTDVREVWKTGFYHCEPSGNLEPQLDTSITVPCQIDT